MEKMSYSDEHMWRERAAEKIQIALMDLAKAQPMVRFSLLVEPAVEPFRADLRALMVRHYEDFDIDYVLRAIRETEKPDMLVMRMIFDAELLFPTKEREIYNLIHSCQEGVTVDVQRRGTKVRIISVSTILPLASLDGELLMHATDELLNSFRMIQALLSDGGKHFNPTLDWWARAGEG